MVEWISKLGSGAFADVWLVRFDDNRKYAVKLLKKPYGTAVMRRFQREGASLIRLRHPNIVSCFGFRRFKGVPGLIMEYLPGGSLRDRLKKGGLTISQSIYIMYKILDAIHYAHCVGLVHRDIKPDNILFDAKGVPKVADFGLVRMLASDSDGLTEGWVGTPGYIAPELVENPEAISTKADIFSAGVTFYEMLTQRTLQFDGRHLLPPSRFNALVNSTLDQIVLRMVAANPAHRYETARQAAEALAPLWKLYHDWEAAQERKSKQELQRAAVGVCALLLIGLVALLGRD